MISLIWYILRIFSRLFSLVDDLRIISTLSRESGKSWQFFDRFWNISISLRFVVFHWMTYYILNILMESLPLNDAFSKYAVIWFPRVASTSIAGKSLLLYTGIEKSNPETLKVPENFQISTFNWCFLFVLIYYTVDALNINLQLLIFCLNYKKQ